MLGVIELEDKSYELQINNTTLTFDQSGVKINRDSEVAYITNNESREVYQLLYEYFNGLWGSNKAKLSNQLDLFIDKYIHDNKFYWLEQLHVNDNVVKLYLDDYEIEFSKDCITINDYISRTEESLDLSKRVFEYMGLSGYMNQTYYDGDIKAGLNESLQELIDEISNISDNKYINLSR